MRCHDSSTTRLLVVTCALLCVVTTPSFAQQARLAAPDARIGDRVIQADHATYEAMQGRIKALNDGGRLVRDYHLAKAQCWLDTSFHEYTRNDRSAFPQEALAESEKLVVAMENRQSPLPMDTPLVNGATRLRPDLWARTATLEAARGFRCAAQKTACAEVELVHAGNEYDQQQWRHAKPYIQIAEDLIGDAEVLAERCDGPPTAAPPAVVAPVRVESLVAHVEFRFDGSGRTDILPAGLDQLEQRIKRATAAGAVLRAVRVVGYADRLNGTGNAAYNQTLSEKRAATVRDLLVARGIAASSIDTAARGDTRPIEACDGGFASKEALEACLLPNRRVDVEFEMESALAR